MSIHRLVLAEVPDRDHAVFEAECGKGTYVRALARDIGRRLGSLGHVVALRRLAVGPFDEETFVTLDDLIAAREAGSVVYARAFPAGPPASGFANCPRSPSPRSMPRGSVAASRCSCAAATRRSSKASPTPRIRARASPSARSRRGSSTRRACFGDRRDRALGSGGRSGGLLHAKAAIEPVVAEWPKRAVVRVAMLNVSCRAAGQRRMRAITMTVLTIEAGPFTFAGRLEEAAAPKTCAVFKRLLPYRQKIIHVRWSGEGCWIPLGDLDLGLGYENHTSHPGPRRRDPLPRGDQRDRDPACLWRRVVRQQGRPVGGKPFPDDYGRSREPGRARQARALGGRQGYSFRPAPLAEAGPARQASRPVAIVLHAKAALSLIVWKSINIINLLRHRAFLWLFSPVSVIFRPLSPARPLCRKKRKPPPSGRPCWTTSWQRPLDDWSRLPDLHAT